MLKRLLCWLVGHDLRVMRQLGLHTQKVRCSCCRTEYVINRSTDTIARWGPDYEKAFASKDRRDL